MHAAPTPQLAYSSPGEMLFGHAPRPVKCGFGMHLGAGAVFPEVNFTLPPMTIAPETWPDVIREYTDIVTRIIRRATALHAPGIVLEFELLPPMTETPEWGAEITSLLKQHLKQAHDSTGLRSALRVTPTDIRDQAKPPVLRSGAPWQHLQRSFDLCIEAGADIVSIESVGGKEVHDYGLMYGDMRAIAFALGVLAPRDMAWLWDQIAAMCEGTGAVPGGDTACGFANTAMQLAGQKMLPDVLASVVRAMSAVRSLVAFRHGAVGPSKDCAYEGPVLKAITGCPISMEGKSATCAHFSPMGNISAALCDLWSNESVQNVRLLSGNAPEAFAESLVYDCRLMNAAIARGTAADLRDCLVQSDEWLNPQAVLMSPDAVWKIARAIVAEACDYRRTIAAGITAVEILREGMEAGKLALPRREREWLDRIDNELRTLPDTERDLIGEMTTEHGSLFTMDSYPPE